MHSKLSIKLMFRGLYDTSKSKVKFAPGSRGQVKDMFICDDQVLSQFVGNMFENHRV